MTLLFVSGSTSALSPEAGRMTAHQPASVVLGAFDYQGRPLRFSDHCSSGWNGAKMVSEFIGRRCVVAGLLSAVVLAGVRGGDRPMGEMGGIRSSLLTWQCGARRLRRRKAACAGESLENVARLAISNCQGVH